jgi:hypothetical protein
MTRRLLLLNLLEQAGDRGVTTGELLNAGVGSRYSARLMELREEGYVEGTREREGSWRYVLAGVGRGAGPGVSSNAPCDPQASLSPSPDQLFTPAPASHYDEAA